MEYLGFGVIRYNIKHINIKDEAITNMEISTYQEEVRNFVGVIK